MIQPCLVVLQVVFVSRAFCWFHRVRVCFQPVRAHSGQSLELTPISTQRWRTLGFICCLVPHSLHDCCRSLLNLGGDLLHFVVQPLRRAIPGTMELRCKFYRGFISGGHALDHRPSVECSLISGSLGCTPGRIGITSAFVTECNTSSSPYPVRSHFLLRFSAS